MTFQANAYSNEPNPAKRTAHAYDVETNAGTFSYVYANNRTQAAARVKRDGFEVRSVNMVG